MRKKPSQFPFQSLLPLSEESEKCNGVYLGRYTHRVAISNNRILSVQDSTVTFRWRDYADNSRQKTMTLKAGEFIRRFLPHILPPRFVRIRHFGLLANRHSKANISVCRELLGSGTTAMKQRDIPETSQEQLLRICGVDISICPLSHKGRMHRVERLQLPVQRPSGSLAMSMSADDKTAVAPHCDNRPLFRLTLLAIG